MKSNEIAKAAPFVCSPTLYQSTDKTGPARTQLDSIDIVNNSSVLIGSSTTRYNNLGYNPDDSYMYAIAEGATRSLLRVEDNGTTTNLGVINGLGSGAYRAGDIDDDGNLWAYSWEEGGNTLYKIDIVTRQTTEVEFTNVTGVAMNSVADFAFKDNKLYGIGYGDPGSTGTKRLYTLDIVAETIESVQVPSLVGANYGAVWITADDHLYFLANLVPGNASLGGSVWEVVNYQGGESANPTVYQVASAGASASLNDGASCREANNIIGYVPVGDDFSDNPITPDTTTDESIFDNDTYNGEVPGAGDPQVKDNVTIGNVDDDGSGATINPDGTITVPDDTPPGEYEITYEMCENARPERCSEGSVIIIVESTNEIIATDDDFGGAIIPTTGGNTPSVFGNDTLEGDPAATTNVTVDLVDDDDSIASKSSSYLQKLQIMVV